VDHREIHLVGEEPAGDVVRTISHQSWSEPLLVGWGERGVWMRAYDPFSDDPSRDSGVDLVPWNADGWGEPQRMIAGVEETPDPFGTFPLSVAIAADFADADMREAAKPASTFDWLPWLVLASLAATLLLIASTVRWRRSRC
jgi:hypothetical protein